MEPDTGFAIVLGILGGLIGLSVFFWAFRLIWEIIRSPVALGILISLFALTVSLFTSMAAQ
jgi:hypothetical protein